MWQCLHNIPCSKSVCSHTCTSGEHTARIWSLYFCLSGIPWTMTPFHSAVCSPTYEYDPALRVPRLFLLLFAYIAPAGFCLSLSAMLHRSLSCDISAWIRYGIDISTSCVLIILGDFCPQGNFLLLRYIHRAYQFIDNLYFLYSLSVYPLRSSNVNLIYKTIQNFGRQFLYFRITSHQ